MAAPKKVFTTAVIVMPPKEMWGPIQAIRQKHDSAFDRWMPHVNLLFPFLEYDALEAGAEKLQKALSEIQPFNVSLQSMRHFEHAKNCVVWLEPTPDRANGVVELQRAVQGVFPMCDEQSKKSAHGFTPHLTLGQFAKKNVEAIKSGYMGNWKPIDFQVNSVYIIRRGKDTPFEIAYEVKLGGK